MFEAMATLVGYIRAGKLRALAVSPATRSPVLPDVPSLGEFVPGYDTSVWFGIGAPRRTPDEILALLNRAINAGLDDPVLKARIGELGGAPLTGAATEFGKLFVEDTERWAKVIKAAGIKGE
jgi:tripartite-type tricarboxylate transporter receptor subunit TctC